MVASHRSKWKTENCKRSQFSCFFFFFSCLTFLCPLVACEWQMHPNVCTLSCPDVSSFLSFSVSVCWGVVTAVSKGLVCYCSLPTPSLWAGEGSLNRSVGVLFLQFLNGDLLLFLSPCPWVFLVGEEGVRGLPTVPWWFLTFFSLSPWPGWERCPTELHGAAAAVSVGVFYFKSLMGDCCFSSP